MPGGNSPRVILYDSSGDNPLVGSTALSSSIPVVLANDHPVIGVSGTIFTQPVPGVTGSITGSVGLSGPVAVSNFPATQSVTQGTSPWIISGSNWVPSTLGLSGSVVGLLQGGQPVSMTNPVPVTGTLSIQGVVAVSGSMDVTGSVKLSQAPQVLQGTNPWIVSGSSWVPQITGSVVIVNRVDITGSNWIPTITGSVVVANQVNITGSTWIPQVTGSVRVTNIVDVTGSNWIPQITGSVRVLNRPDVLVNSGSVTGLLVGGQPATMQNAVPVTGTVALQGILSVSGGLETATFGVSGSTQIQFAVDSLGRVITAPAGATSTNAGFVFGKMDTTLQTLAVIEHTTYTEQTSNARRSIVSTSGSDHWASGSAQQITITYYTVSGSGPKTEIINLSGTTSVDTVNADICYIEKLEVTRAGAYTTNSGTISLKSTTGGGGTTIGSIGGSAGQTFWCHHYIPSGSTCYITGLLGGKNNNTSQGSGGTFHIKATPLNQLTPIKKQISDFLNSYGQANTNERAYGTPISVVGPQKIDVWVYPDSALTTTYLASIDFYEQSS